MHCVYDAGLLIAADRDDRAVWADHRARLEAGLLPVTTAPVVAQVSRTARQVSLRRFLRGCDVRPFDGADMHAVGDLLRRSATSDVVDGHIVLIAARSAASGTDSRVEIRTSDPQDLQRLAASAGLSVSLHRV